MRDREPHLLRHARALPNLRLQGSHLGGTAPFLAHRLAALEAREPERTTRAPAGALDYDTGLSNHALAVRPYDRARRGRADRVRHGPAVRRPPGHGRPRADLAELDGGVRAGIDAANAAALVPRFAAELAPVTDTENAAGAMRRRLFELAEDQRWVHHVADLDAGETQTAALDRPVAPLSRAARLSRLAGHHFDPSIFGTPTYRLTPQRPYQPSPEGWIEVSRPTYYAPAPGGDLCWWEPPRDFDPRTNFFGLRFSFTSVPVGQRSVTSMSFSGHPFAGTTGHLLLQAQLVPNTVTVPVDGAFGAHTVDFTFVTPQSSLDVVVGLLPGIELLAFTRVTFGPAPLVLDPGGAFRDEA